MIDAKEKHLRITLREIFDEDERTQKMKGYGNIPKGSIVEVLDKYHNMYGYFVNVKYHNIVYATKEEYLGSINLSDEYDINAYTCTDDISRKERMNILIDHKERFCINVLNALSQEIESLEVSICDNPLEVHKSCKDIVNRYITNVKNSMK